MKALRQTVHLSAYPDLVVVYLGMTVNVLTGIKTLFGFGPKIEGSVAAQPDGLLLHAESPVFVNRAFLAINEALSPLE